jgi:oryzin
MHALKLIVSTVISGINWTVNDSKTRFRNGTFTGLLAVGGSYSASLNQAVASAASAGIMFAVAAGGQNTGVGSVSPASEPSACTVGGTTRADARTSSSNYGAGSKWSYR